MGLQTFTSSIPMNFHERDKVSKILLDIKKFKRIFEYIDYDSPHLDMEYIVRHSSNRC